MKKSIGLTANISEYRPNLPQTRHLNYFMGTNPVHMAGGGDVKAGIPNYPDVNVTRGFLPAALGFDNGGEADKDTVTQIYDFIFGYFKNVLGLDDEKAKEETEETIKDPEKIEKIIKTYSPPSQELFDKEEEIKGLETPRTTTTPIETAKASPFKPPSQDVFEKEEEIKGIPTERTVQPDEGITGIPQEVFDKEELIKGLETPRKEYKLADLNKDGVVDGKDLEIARNNPLYGWAIKIIEGIIGGFDDLKEDKISPLVPPISEEQKLRDKEEEIKGIETKRQPDTTDGGIAKLPIVSEEQKLRDKEDKWTGLGVEEQKLLKKGAAIAGGGDPDIPDDPTTKKDVPAWALPLMSAGFAMMSSKSPYFLQALGEGGQEGIKTLTAQQEGKTAKEKTEAEIEQALATAAYYRGEGKQGAPKLVEQNGLLFHMVQGKLVPIYMPDGTTQATALPSDQEAKEWLLKNHMQYQMAVQSEDLAEQQKWIDWYRGVRTQATQAAIAGTGGGEGWGISDFFGKVGAGIKEGITAKDGGIVSLRR